MRFLVKSLNIQYSHSYSNSPMKFRIIETLLTVIFPIFSMVLCTSQSKLVLFHHHRLVVRVSPATMNDSTQTLYFERILGFKFTPDLKQHIYIQSNAKEAGKNGRLTYIALQGIFHFFCDIVSLQESVQAKNENLLLY